MKTGGEKYSQNLVVKKDPRVAAPSNVFIEQLKFALKLDSAINKTTKLYQHVNKKLKENGEMSKSETDSLKEIRSGLSKIDAALASLTSSVQTADASPTQGVRDVFEAYKKQLDQIEKQLKIE